MPVAPLLPKLRLTLLPDKLGSLWRYCLTYLGQTFIKQFYVDSYASERDGSPLLRFNVPINLAKDLDVVFSRDRDAAGAQIEYPLHESISVSGKSTWQLNSKKIATLLIIATLGSI